MSRRWIILLFVFAAFCLGEPTKAAVLFSGGEDVDFICGSNGSCSYTTTAGSYRPNWARQALEIRGSTTDPATYTLSTPVLSGQTTLWVHAQVCDAPYLNCSAGTYNGAQLIRLMDGNGNASIIVRGTGNASELKISSRGSTGTFTDLVTCPGVTAASIQQVDLYVNYGTSGEVSLYANSKKVCDYSGNTTNGDGSTSLIQVQLAGAYPDWVYWSEVIVANEDTRAMSRYTAYTKGDGATTGFSGTNVCSSIWAAASYNDANYAYTPAANVIHECTIASSLPAGSYKVMGLGMSTRSLIGASGPQNFNFVTRVNGSDYFSANFTPTMSFSNISNYFQSVNPATGAAWTVSDLENAGFNIGLRSQP